MSNLPKGLGGSFPKLRYFTHIAKILVQAEHYSFIWQVYSRERKGFGLKLVNSVIKHRGREVFSATNIFQTGISASLLHVFRLLGQRLLKGEQDAARALELMAKSYGLSLTLGDGTFVPCSAWTWASYSFRGGGSGIPTPLSVRVERDWFHHDLLEEIYKEMGFRPQDTSCWRPLRGLAKDGKPAAF